METYAIRLKPDQDLKEELKRFTKSNNIKSGFILTGIGSLKKAVIRTSNTDIKEFNELFEINGINGTLSLDGIHVHINIADKNGHSFGGHLKEGCIIHTTAEIIIGTSKDFEFTREFDNKTRFKELQIK